MMKKKPKFKKLDLNLKQHTEPYFNTSSKTSSSDINRTNQSLDSTRSKENISDSLEAVTLQDNGNTISSNDYSLVEPKSSSRSYSQNNQKQGGDYYRSHSKYESEYSGINNLKSIPEPIAAEMLNVNAEIFVPKTKSVVPNRVNSHSHEFTHEDSGIPLIKQSKFLNNSEIPKNVVKPERDIDNEVSSTGATIREWSITPNLELSNTYLEGDEHKRGNYNNDRRRPNKSSRDFSRQSDKQQHIRDEVHVKSYAGVANSSSNNTSSYPEEGDLNRDAYRNNHKKGNSGADNRLVNKSHRTNYNQSSSNQASGYSKNRNNSTNPHIDKKEHNVLSCARTTNLSSNGAVNDTPLYSEVDKRRNDSEQRPYTSNRYGNKSSKENYNRSYDGKCSSNQGVNNSFRQQSKKRYSDPGFERGRQSRNLTSNPDEEYQQFLSYKGFIKTIEEKDQDLFAMPKDYALAHCVAEDMRMGSGIAVQFKKDFKRVDELLQQNAREGSLAILNITTDNNDNRYIYYMVTKKLSNLKPTYSNFWSSLKEMRNHIRDNNVKKLAMPKIGCGLDRLEWFKVKQMIEFLFKDVDVDIVVCNFQQSEENPSKDYNTCKIVHKEMSVADIEPYTIIVYLSTEDGHFSDDMNQLAEKFNFKNRFQTDRKRLGDCIKFKQPTYSLYGCIVRKTAKSQFDYLSFKKCLLEINKDNQKDAYVYVALQAIKDENDPIINEKLVTIMRGYLRKVEIYFCWDGELSDQMPMRRQDLRASLTAFDKQQSSNQTPDISKTQNKYNPERPHIDVGVHNDINCDSTANSITNDDILNDTSWDPVDDQNIRKYGGDDSDRRKSSNQTPDLSKTQINYGPETLHIDEMNYASTANSSTNDQNWNDISLDTERGDQSICKNEGDDSASNGHNKSGKENCNRSSDRRKSSNQGMNNSISLLSKRDSDPPVDSDMQSRTSISNSEEERQQFKSYIQNKNENFIKVIERDQDLFTMPKDYALAHCVAEDMSMGSGIAVNFRRDFKRVDELRQQKAKQGGLAILDDNDRFIYYLVTKRNSTGKPTYDTFWSSVRKMRNHIRDHNVKKLAMPRIGCGLDGLEWSRVKLKIEFLFKDLDIEIVICNFQQNYGKAKQKLQVTPSKSKKDKQKKKKKK